MYRPGLLPFSIFSLLLGFTMAYIVAKYFWAGGRIDRVMYFVCFFCFGCMNTSGINEAGTYAGYLNKVYLGYCRVCATA